MATLWRFALLCLMIAVLLGSAAAAFSFPKQFENDSPSFISRIQHWILHGAAVDRMDRDDWPKFEVNWKLIVSTVIILLGSAAASGAGVGGGGIFIPMLTLLLGFDPKSAAALSKSLVFVGSTTTALNNIRVKHHRLNRPLIDYGMALLLQPMLMLGISIGVICNSTFPDWVLTILLILVVTSMAVKSFNNGVSSWKKETEAARKEGFKSNGTGPTLHPVISRSNDEAGLGSLREPLLPEGQTQEPFFWIEIGLMAVVWLVFSIIQIVKEMKAEKCGALYWILNASQIPVSFAAAATGGWRIWKQQYARLAVDDSSEAEEVTWTLRRLVLYPLITCFAGTVGGFIGIGGGMILGPMFLELGVSPQVTSATSTFMIMFSSSMSVLEYYLLGRLPVNFAVYFGVGILVAAHSGVYIMRQLVYITGRASVITFTLGTIIAVSAIFLGAVGTLKNIRAYMAGAYMGFESLCDS